MDVELVVRAQRGDAEAFTALVDAMGGRLHAVAYSILRDRDAAADATQRALIAAWQGLPGLRDPAAFTCVAHVVPKLNTIDTALLAISVCDKNKPQKPAPED